MRFSNLSLFAAVFVLAAGVSVLAASFSVRFIEESSEIEVRSILDRSGLTWAEVEADGLRVIMSGTAPTEALRFRTLSLAGSVVDSARIADEMTVVAAAILEAPRFSVEVLRNTAGLSIIGLIPASTNRQTLIERFQHIGEAEITDLLEVADYPPPQGWEDALAFAANAIEDLPRAKVSVDAGRVEITAIADTAEAKARMERQLTQTAPPSLRLTLNISAPRPVITPFTLRFVIDDKGARFDACSADTESSQTRILNAAAGAGLKDAGRCTIGMGSPSPKWADAVETSIAALATIGGGTVTFSNADVSLVATEGSAEDLFERVVGELENDLPDAFVLTATLPRASEEEDSGPSEFVATLSPEGQIQLRGRVSSQEMKEIADSFARAKFGSDKVYTAARVVPNLPTTWSTRVLTGIEALGYLNNGVVTVTPDYLVLSGRSGNADTQGEITRLIVDKLGDGTSFDIDVEYVEALDPVAALPTPDECEAQIAEIVSGGKISFEPSSATIADSALSTMDEIAAVLQECGDLKLEVQGHTDSQGREEMNLALSQARAESVLNELRARRVLTKSYVAKGYGETEPVADNDTETGREANRRIEFKLIRPEPSLTEGDTARESLAEKGETEGTDPDTLQASDTEGNQND